MSPENALKAIAGVTPWPDPDMGYVDLARATLGETSTHAVTDNQIKHMVDRFLSWDLPGDFQPDGGIRFDQEFRSVQGVSIHKPVGTNLLTATQAEAMIRHMIAELPQ